VFVLLDHTTIIYHISAATTSFNAVDNISELFGGVGYVNGQEVEGDAQSVAEYWGGISNHVGILVVCVCFGLWLNRFDICY